MKGIQKRSKRPIRILSREVNRSQIIPSQRSCFLFLIILSKTFRQSGHNLFFIAKLKHTLLLTYHQKWLVLRPKFHWPIPLRWQILESKMITWRIVKVQNSFTRKHATIATFRIWRINFIANQDLLELKIVRVNLVHCRHALYMENCRKKIRYFTCTFVMGTYNSPPCLLHDIIGTDQSDFSFVWNSLWKWWIDFILFIKNCTKK